MQQTPSSGAQPATSPTFTHSGQIYLLGYTSQAYGIWDRRNPSVPVASFPVTDAGWGTAWAQFSAWEPAAVPVAQVQPAAAATPPVTPAPAPAAAPTPAWSAPTEVTPVIPAASSAPATSAPATVPLGTAAPAATPSVEAEPVEVEAPPPPLPTSTGSELPGHEISESLGLCLGVAVRSSGAAKGLFKVQDATAQVSVAELEEARTRAVGRMMDRARQLEADAVVAVRFDTSLVGDVTEIVAYGTAVKLKGGMPSAHPDRADQKR
jgi:uncharacterized protein YbjQ (UPF0145 family)